jgi:hypothetical protein
MPTHRTRISRAKQRPAITPAAVELFEAMRALPCDCPPIVDFSSDYWKRCAGCQERARIDELLHVELGLRPWERTIQSPRARSPYPPGSPADRSWRPDHAAQRRWRKLEKAAGG